MVTQPDDPSPPQNGTQPQSPQTPQTLQETCNDLATRLDTFLSSTPNTSILRDVQAQTRIARDVVKDALRRYRLEEISLSYNGGKDCLVLLIIFLAALGTPARSEVMTAWSSPGPETEAEKKTTSAQHTPTCPPLPSRLQSVYIISAHPFPEVDAFVDDSVARYQLELARYAMGMKEGFAQYLEDRRAQGAEVKAIFVGTRRTDPHGARLSHFDETDGGWPRFMRVHPVIDWHYAEIWAFLKHLEISYCKLYDMGYTSLGGTTDTHRNPALKSDGDGGGQTFRPAYELVEDDAERLGRDW